MTIPCRHEAVGEMPELISRLRVEHSSDAFEQVRTVGQPVGEQILDRAPVGAPDHTYAPAPYLISAFSPDKDTPKTGRAAGEDQQTDAEASVHNDPF